MSAKRQTEKLIEIAVFEFFLKDNQAIEEKTLS
jgi:hypothetical protein